MSDTSKTIHVSESLHARIKAQNREDETLGETLERLLDGPSLRELAGTLSDEDAAMMREAIDASHMQHAGELDEQFDEVD
jgi:hypothetical protein